MNYDSSNIAIIIRAIGERTEALSEYIVRCQISYDRVVVIHEAPFSRAVQRSFEIGVDFNQDWTICLDADVLLRRGSIIDLINFAETLPQSVGKIEGKFLDKLLGHFRSGGAHLYRTSFLRDALQFASFTNDSIRPESLVMEQMRELGYEFNVANIIIGIHDYEQYFRDIYRKAMVYSRKYDNRMQYAVKYWRRLAQSDSDYRVALMGLRAGQKFNGRLAIDSRIFPQQLDSLLKSIGLIEKQGLDFNQYLLHGIEETLDQYAPSPEYLAWQQTSGWQRSLYRFWNRIQRLR